MKAFRKLPLLLAALALFVCAPSGAAFAAVIPLDSRIAVAVSGGYWIEGGCERGGRG